MTEDPTLGRAISMVIDELILRFLAGMKLRGTLSVIVFWFRVEITSVLLNLW
jgi:hypothetical protein